MPCSALHCPTALLTQPRMAPSHSVCIFYVPLLMAELACCTALGN